MPERSYEAMALVEAGRRNLTAHDVQQLGYAEVAELAGVRIEPNGDSPSDFFYQNVREAVRHELGFRFDELRLETERAEIEVMLRMHPDWANAQITVGEDGDYHVHLRDDDPFGHGDLLNGIR